MRSWRKGGAPHKRRQRRPLGARGWDCPRRRRAPVRQGPGQGGRKRASMDAKLGRMGLNRGATERKPRYINWNFGSTGRKLATMGRNAAAMGLKRAPGQKNPIEPRSDWTCLGVGAVCGRLVGSGVGLSPATAVVAAASTKQPSAATVLHNGFIALSRSSLMIPHYVAAMVLATGLASCCTLTARAA